jgi:tripartite-type tricarboxylate transporter receptor subunit TctC
VIVDNRVGGSGLVGTRTVIRSAPDGYTLFLGHTGSISINPSLYVHAGFDPRKDLTAIGLFASMPVALLAHPSFPAKTIGEVVALAKKEGGKLNIGTSAVGTGGYLSAELFKSITGVQATIVPYKGTAQLMNDLLGGHVPVAFGVLPPALGNLASGTLRAIAVTGTRRFSLLPDVPTAAESGLPGFDSVLHYGLLAPAGTPRPIVDRLNAEMRKLVDTDLVKQRIQTEGGDALTSTPDEYAADIDREEKKWSALIKKLNLKVE